MRFRRFDELRAFTIVARHGSFSAAADELGLTKGAVSHQMRLLEQQLGFALFFRQPRGIELTFKGKELLGAAQAALEDVEQRIADLRNFRSRGLTVGVSTYFAARWLAPKLMTFMQAHPDIQLRIQPMIQFADHELRDIDVAIRWGKGDWGEGTVIPFMAAPAFPVGNKDAAKVVKSEGIHHAISEFPLLRDRDDSNAWSEWLNIAELAPQRRSEAVVTPDPNVRVQAVINGQGLALMDCLVTDEMKNAKLFRLSDLELADYGYFLFRPNNVVVSGAARFFTSWLQEQS
ncbi:MAG: LysR family transcriptional regulator [Pseudomonadota bacterium]